MWLAMTIWYLSFATTERFLGAAVIEAHEMLDAVAEAHRLGINPGGEVLGVPVPEEHEAEARTVMNRLLSRADMVKLGMAPRRVHVRTKRSPRIM
jgi:hypothetical protein